jgi:hypothetical protein
LVPPGVAPSFGASVNSQTLPATSAASEVGPAAPWACASVGKFSSRQYNGPDGSSVTFFSTTGSTKNFEGYVNSPKAHSENTNAPIRRALRDRRSMVTQPVGQKEKQ